MATYRARKSSLGRRIDKRTKRSRNKTAAALIRQPVDARLNDLISRISDLPLTRLPELINCARSHSTVNMQEEVVRVCLQQILSHKSSAVRVPRHEQVRTLRRLIFGSSDVLLIARTGFGKSLIFHAYSILTGKMTLQLIPLTKLGDEQLCDIRHFSGSRPCLLNAKTRTEEKDILRRIAAGEYTHVLLGPEQASSRSFRNMLKNTELQARIGLVAIDECHLVMQWEKFRPAFTLLGQLRTILHRNIVWFGCSATLDEASERRVLDTAGFRVVGNCMYQTEVIRTSVDRPDVAISVIPIPRGKLLSWDILYFLLQSAVHDGHATPRDVPKTIIFIDGRNSVHDAAAWAMDKLLQLSSEYSTDPSTNERCVFNVVCTFTAHVSQYDRDIAYNEFLGPDSRIRLMFATTSLGMGINIPDVARVVTWKIPITVSLGDLWQRFGRGGRGEGLTSQAYVMLPYWLFDTQGTYKPNARLSTPTDDSASLPGTKNSMRNQLPSDRARLRNFLLQCATPGDASDPEDDSQDLLDNQSEVGLLENQNSGPLRRPRYWTKAEIRQRSRLPRPWLRMVNGTCYRKGFLRNLGEEKLAPSERQSIAKDRCCSACNPTLLPNIIWPPTRAVPLGIPRLNTHAYFVYELVEAFAVQRAIALFAGEHLRYPMPAGAYMSRSCRLELVYALVGPIPEPDVAAPLVTSNTAFDTMCRNVPLLGCWDLRDAECGQLMDALSGIKRTALGKFVMHSEAARKRREDRKKAADNKIGSASQPVEPMALESLHRERDNEVATQVAEEIAEKTATVVASDTAAENMLSAPNRQQHRIKETTRRRPLRERIASSANNTLRRGNAAAAASKSSTETLSFITFSSRGRLRTLTSKGKENYR